MIMNNLKSSMKSYEAGWVNHGHGARMDGVAYVDGVYMLWDLGTCIYTFYL